MCRSNIVGRSVNMNSYLESMKEKIVSAYGVRFFPKQKKRFLQFVQEELNELGWKDREIIKGNLVVGDIKNAEFIFTAHYDTPGRMPSFFGFLFKIFGHTRQILAMSAIFIFLLMFTKIMVLYKKFFILSMISPVVLILSIWLIISILTPNRKNYNDNTSGALTLLNIANEISKNNEHMKKKTALVFFNNEEWGLLGSAAMKKYWNKNGVQIQNKRIINFDCVGNGNIVMLTHGKNSGLAEDLESALSKSSNKDIIKFKYRIIPLSDDYNFRNSNTVGIVFCNESIIPGGYYIPLVHSSKDIKLRLENIEWITAEVIKII